MVRRQHRRWNPSDDVRSKQRSPCCTSEWCRVPDGNSILFENWGVPSEKHLHAACQVWDDQRGKACGNAGAQSKRKALLDRSAERSNDLCKRRCCPRERQGSHQPDQWSHWPFGADGLSQAVLHRRADGRGGDPQDAPSEQPAFSWAGRWHREQCPCTGWCTGLYRHEYAQSHENFHENSEGPLHEGSLWLCGRWCALAGGASVQARRSRFHSQWCCGQPE